MIKHSNQQEVMEAMLRQDKNQRGLLESQKSIEDALQRQLQKPALQAQTKEGRIAQLQVKQSLTPGEQVELELLLQFVWGIK